MDTHKLVTGVASRIGVVGWSVTELLLKQGQRVRAMVRNDDERTQSLRALGAEIVVSHAKYLDLSRQNRVSRQAIYSAM